MDGLRLATVPLAPEIRLHLAEDAVIFWARLEAEAKCAVPAPFWASAWAGGQALARFLLDNKEIVAGKRVLDLGSGSGLAAIAAGLAGAGSVTANDIDPHAITAIHMNARANQVDITVKSGDMLHERDDEVDVVLIGDMLYSDSMAKIILPFMRSQRARGTQILLGDPGRGHLPETELELLATYKLADSGAGSDAQLKSVDVFSLAAQ